MGHLGKEEVYRALAERLNKNPVGAPVNETLMGILKKLYTEAEAQTGSQFPLYPVKLEAVQEATGMAAGPLEEILEGMADKGLVMDIPRRDGTYYILSPMVVGFFEYTFMRVKREDMQELARLFEAYFSSDGVREEMFGAPTKMFRSMAYESLIPALVETEVLSYEKASELIRQSGGGALSACSCRHKAMHLGKACEAPIEDTCMSLGNAAKWLVSRGFGRQAGVDELLGVLERSEKQGLVLLGDNVLNNPAYICHCCGCCCGVLRAINEEGIGSVQPSNFLPRLDEEACTGCESCIESCHIAALNAGEKGEPVLNEEKCIGCGVCVSVCPVGALQLLRIASEQPVPENKKDQFQRIAREKGKM